MFKKESIRWIITGIVVGVGVCYVFWFYQLSKVTFTDHATVNAIVECLNKRCFDTTQQSPILSPVK